MVQKACIIIYSFLSFIIALMLTRKSAHARNCYCLASYTCPPPLPHHNRNLVPSVHRALCALCTITHACQNIMATTVSYNCKCALFASLMFYLSK